MYLEKSSTRAALQVWPAKARASASCEDRHRILARQLERIDYVALVARNDDSEGNAPVVGGVGRVNGLRGGVEAHVAFHAAAQLGLEIRGQARLEP